MPTQKRLTFFVYASRIACSPEAIKDITRTAQVHNQNDGITGALVHDRTHFLQLLEGPPVAVGTTFLRIAGDDRHSEITVLASEPAEARLFSGWSLRTQPFPDRRTTLLRFVGGLQGLDRAARSERLRLFGLSLDAADRA